MSATGLCRVLVMDDDAAFAGYLVRGVEMEPDIEVVGCASSDVRVIVLTAAPSPAVRRDVTAAHGWTLLDEVVRPGHLTDAIHEAGHRL